MMMMMIMMMMIVMIVIVIVIVMIMMMILMMMIVMRRCSRDRGVICNKSNSRWPQGKAVSSRILVITKCKVESSLLVSAYISRVGMRRTHCN